jgi:hypothetical protein
MITSQDVHEDKETGASKLSVIGRNMTLTFGIDEYAMLQGKEKLRMLLN